MAKEKRIDPENVETEKVTAKVREIEHIAGNKPDDGKEYLHTNIGFNRAADTKYEVYWLLPVTGIREDLIALSEECQKRYDCTLVDLIESGVRQFTTRPDYQGVGFDAFGNLKEDGHKFMQDMADNYKAGARVAASGGVKAKAKKLDTMVEKYGAGSQEELEARLAKMIELEKQGLL